MTRKTIIHFRQNRQRTAYPRHTHAPKRIKTQEVPASRE
jgi:hypothetical protein